MTKSAYAKNAYLNGATFTHVACGETYPGVTGTGEIAGSRVAVSVGPAAGGVRTLTSAVNMTISAGKTVRWLLWFDGSNYMECDPNGGATPRNFVVLTGTDVFYSSGHGFAEGQKVVFYGGTVPGGITEGAIYYVRDSSADTFRVATTLGGAAVDVTASAPYACAVCAITEDVYAGGGTHTLSSATKVFPA